MLWTLRFFQRHSDISAEEGTRTPTAFRPPAPKAGASANSATSASTGSFDYTGELDSENNQIYAPLSEAMNWIPETTFPFRWSSFVMNKSIRAWAAQAS